MRWRTEGDDAQAALFPDAERHIGRGEFRGMEFLHVKARSIINTLPAGSHLPFRHTINAYRGCSHACTYCAWGETPVLMADGRTRPLAELRVGDRIVGTQVVGRYRRYVETTVLDHWSVVRPAWRTTLDDGTTLVTSGDHRFLSDRGWKYVTGREQGELRRPHLTSTNRVLGPGRLVDGPKSGEEYRRGYLSGMVRGDGHIGHYAYPTGERKRGVHLFRLALADPEPLERTRRYLGDAGVSTRAWVFQEETSARRRVDAIGTSRRADVSAVEALISWPEGPCEEWTRGFLAGIFDAEGSCSRGVLRIANTDPEIIERVTGALERLGFAFAVERTNRRACAYVRLLGGLSEQLRFFMAVDPATSRKRTVVGRAVKNSPARRVVAVEPLGMDLPLYDMTTGTGDYVAEGVISHNCFARPTHDYLGLDIGEGFERQVVVKVNAVERLRAELDPRKWCGEPIAMGTNTDPYQRAEGKYHLTRGLIEELGRARNPFSILTKSTLVLRDAEALAEAAERTDVSVSFSVGTLDEEVWRATEPGTPPPWKRLEALAKLKEHGLRCGVLVAPVLPGLSDTAESLDAVVKAATEAGADSVSGGMVVYLKPGVREVFLGHLARTHPHLVPRYEAMYRGVNAPSSERRRVADLLAEARARHRARAVAPPRPAPHRNPPPPARRRPVPAGEQLGLGV